MADDQLTPDEATPQEAALAVVARHALHDEELVVALASGSLDEDAEIHRAQSFVDRCSVCRDLDRDIAAIGAGLRQDARGTMAAPRDFRLTIEDARRLGGPVSVGGFAAAFRRAVTSFAAPVGASMAALGIVGLLVGTVSLGGGTAAAPNAAAGTGQTEATNAPAGVRPGDAPKASSDLSVAAGPASTAYAVETDSATPRDVTAAPAPNPAAWLLGGSVVVLLAGLVLLFITFRRGRST